MKLRRLRSPIVAGAPEILLHRCSHYIRRDGTYAILDVESSATLASMQAEFASRGQRVLLLAKKVVRALTTKREVFTTPSLLEDALVAQNRDLVACGLIALVDPPREDTAETVRICRRAGIRFLMGKSHTYVHEDFRLIRACYSHWRLRFDSRVNCYTVRYNHQSAC